MIFILRNEEIRSRCIEYLRRLDISVPQEVNIRAFKSRRNSAQNRLYWQILNEIADAMGKNAEVLHEYCKRKWIGCDEQEVGGETVKVGLSTTTLDVGEFSDYVTKVQHWAAEEFGIVS